LELLLDRCVAGIHADSSHPPLSQVAPLTWDAGRSNDNARAKEPRGLTGTVQMRVLSSVPAMTMPVKQQPRIGLVRAQILALGLELSLLPSPKPVVALY
jgi:hypothetical protein